MLGALHRFAGLRVLLLGVGEGALQDGHQIGDGAAGRQDPGLGRVRGFDAGEAGFDDLLQGVGVLVVFGLDVEVLGDGVHQRPGELDLLGAQLDALGSDAGGVADLVGPQQGLEHDDVFAHPAGRPAIRGS
ncbi:hypothetical protein [Kitasatospora sp. NBC_00039]|uniref:hypothetical protein n=1 Tax=Kitasatospora sp. NBC_00039 TaxID=2903565 RepID=UPI00325614E7